MFVFEYIRSYDNAAGTATFNVFRIRALGTADKYLDFDGDGKEDGQVLLATAEPQAEGSHEFTLRSQRKSATFADIDLPIFSVMSVLSNNARAIDVSGVSKDPGGLIHMWSGGAADNQKWFFELVADVESEKIIPRGNQDIPIE
jgi:hypothetical protein